jgi:hypothetical protein
LYPKCTACGLSIHYVEQCHPLVNFCLAQALYVKHPDIVRKIKADYKQFPCTARGFPSHPSTVKQLVEDLGLLPSCPVLDVDVDTSASIYHFALPDLLAPALYFGQTGTAMVFQNYHTDIAGPPDATGTYFTVSPVVDSMFLLYQDDDAATRDVTDLNSQDNYN